MYKVIKRISSFFCTCTHTTMEHKKKFYSVRVISKKDGAWNLRYDLSSNTARRKYQMTLIWFSLTSGCRRQMVLLVWIENLEIRAIIKNSDYKKISRFFFFETRLLFWQFSPKELKLLRLRNLTPHRKLLP